MLGRLWARGSKATMSQTINSKVAAGGGLPRQICREAWMRLESSPVLDLCTLVGDLADAISVVTVGYPLARCIGDSRVADEEAALRYALSLLRSAYSALDMASCRAS